MAQSTSPAPGGTNASVQSLPGTEQRTSSACLPIALAQAAASAVGSSPDAMPDRQAAQHQRPGAGAGRAHRVRHPDELAERRERLRAERREIEARADSRLHEMQAQEFIRVPRLMVAVTNSLAAASVLELARLWTERSMHERGTPWVDMPAQTWLNYTGLGEQEWVEARRALRAQRLIQERRRFDLDRNELVCDIAFEPQVFADHVADLKDALKTHLAEEVRARRPGASRSRHPAGTGSEGKQS